MNKYMISNDFLEIITDTTNKLHPAYMEASKNLDSSNDKALGYIKNFITSIENIANKEKVKDSRITDSRGNIKKFSAYEDIKTILDFLKKNLSGVSVVNDLSTILTILESNQPLYTEAYEKNIRLVVLEYESAVDLLVTGITLTMAECIDVVQTGTSVKIEKKKGANGGVIHKTISDMATQMRAKNHKKYLEEMIESKKHTKIDTSIKESVTFIESAVADSLELIDLMLTSVGKIGHYTMNIIRTIKNSLFGILPLIRSCLYIRYKKKADTILALEQQAEFVSQNIERLQNRTNMDEKEKARIIKKQQANVEAYKKKAAKLRAELIDCEKQASDAIKKENPSMKNTDDDFILEKTGFKASDDEDNMDETEEDEKESKDKEE